MNEKGTSFSIMFIYIAMVVIGSSSLIDLSRSFSFLYILKLIIDCILLGGYYLLIKEKKIGFLIMWLCIPILILLIGLSLSFHQVITIIFSYEFLLNIAVTLTIFPKLKNMK